MREGDQVELRQLLFTLDTELQLADVAMQEAAVKNAQQAYDRAAALVKSMSGTQKALDDAEAALRTRAGAAQLRADQAGAPQGVQPGRRQRPADLLPCRRAGAGRQADRRASCRPANLKVRFFVNEATLPKLKFGDPVVIRCDGCAADITAKISFISRTSEFTPPVIYSMEERSSSCS